MRRRSRGRMRRRAASVPCTVPRYVTSVTRRTSSAARPATGETTVTIALLTQMSIGPRRSSIIDAALSTSAACATSATHMSPLPPSASTSLQVACSASGSRAISPTCAPRRANARAVARPTPALAPVTTTTSTSRAPGKRHLQHFGEMHGMTLRALRDLLAATVAVGHDEAIGSCRAHRGQKNELADLHGQAGLVALEAERARHPATSGVKQLVVDAYLAQHGLVGVHRHHGFLMAMAVDDRAAREAR